MSERRPAGNAAVGDEIIELGEAWVPGEAEPQKRPRTVRLFGKDGKPVLRDDGRPLLKTYIPKQTLLYRERVAQAVGEQAGRKAEGPVVLDVDTLFNLPKSLRRKNADLEPLWKPTRPDIPNLLALIADALEGIAYDDDARIVAVRFCKQFTRGQAGVRLRVCEISPRAAPEALRQELLLPIEV